MRKTHRTKRETTRHVARHSRPTRGEDAVSLSERRPDWLSRRVAATILAVLVVVGAVGAYVLLTGEPEAMDRVPREADAVAHVDGERLSENETIRNVTLEAYHFQTVNRYYRGPHLDEQLAPILESNEVSLTDANGLTFYANHTSQTRVDENYTGMVVEADWEVRALVGAVANETTKTTYAGHDLYLPAGEGRAVAVLDNGLFAVGTPAAVRDAVDVAEGNAPSVDGDLRDAFQTAREERAGYTTFAYPFPTGAVPDIAFVNTSAFHSITTVTGVYYQNQTANGTNLGIELRLRTGGEVAARDVANTLSLGVSFYAQRRNDPALKRAASQVKTRHPESTAVVIYESDPAQVSALIRALNR